MKKMKELCQCVKKEKKIQWTKATLPLFEDKPPQLHALIVLALGYDVFSGIKGFGPSTVDKGLRGLLPKQLKKKEI